MLLGAVFESGIGVGVGQVGEAGQGRRPLDRAKPVRASRMFSNWRWASMFSAALRWAETPSSSPLVSRATMTSTMASSTSVKPLLRCG